MLKLSLFSLGKQIYIIFDFDISFNCGIGQVSFKYSLGVLRASI